MKLTREQVDYHLLKDNEKDEAIRFCIKVFTESYGENVIPTPEQFAKTLTRPGYKESLDLFGAYVDGKLVGVQGMRSNTTYGALFYVDVHYQGTGLAGIMFRAMIEEYAPKGPIYMLANYTKVEMYKHMGFVPTEEEQNVNGFRFVPMVYFKMKDYQPEYYKEKEQ